MTIITRILSFILILALVPAASASEFLFSLSTDNLEAIAADSGHPETHSWPIRLTGNIEQRLVKGKVLSLALPGNRYIDSILEEILPGRGLLAYANTTETHIASLKTGHGSVEIYLSNGKIQGMLVLDMDTDQAYEARFDASGQGTLQEQDPNQYYCVSYPRPAQAPRLEESVFATADAAPTPDLDSLKHLQSNPGAPNVLYIDYWGGSVSNTAWNLDFNIDTINYTPFSQDSDTANFSDNERHDMWLAWAEVAEDYAPFHVNVTTDAAVYAATQVGQRVQIIATTTCDWYNKCGAGGVAYVDVFSGFPEIYRTGWAWHSSQSSLGMTISHEAGHQMGLYHDGNTNSPYDSGHGDWGPIMGGPFGKSYVQWSKGEYPGADNSENDLEIVKGSLGENGDEAGEDMGSATPLKLPVVGFTGVLSPEGLGKDIDVFSFSIPYTKTVRFEVGPPLGILGERMGTNLSLKARLLDSSGGVLAQLTPDSHPSSNVMKETLQLAAGDYSLVLEALSYDSDWSTGFGEYANGGYYSISIEPERGPDLAADAQANSPIVISAGETFGLLSTVMNQGDAGSASTVLRYFMANHDSITQNDSETAEASDVQALSPQQSIQVTQSIVAPGDMPLGHHWIASCVDAVPGEQQTGNNCSPSIEIIVATGTCSSSTAIAAQGETFSSYDYRKSGHSILLSDSSVLNGGELYLESPLIQLGAPGGVFAVENGGRLLIKSTAPNCP